MIDMRTRWIALAVAFLAAAPADLRAQAGTAAAEARGQAAEEARLQAELQAEEAYRAALEAAEEERRAAEEVLERARAEVERQQIERERSREEGQRALAAREAERAEREREVARMREELARTHEELRRASREVARVNRELNRGAAPRAFVVNVSERPVIGVALGANAGDGVEIVGVSPDGPAERAGIEQGDVIVSIGGQALASGNGNDISRELIYEVMEEVEAGEEVPVTVRRDGETLEFLVTAEAREPFVWQSLQRLPSPPRAPGAPGAPLAPNVLVERIEIPRIDTERLAQQIHEITEDVNRRVLVLPDGAGDFSVDVQAFSHLGDEALAEADMWFGLSAARGLELAPLNAGLGEYFDADRGVLVLSAREDNALELETGDVILGVGDDEIARPSDFMRALRRIEPGSAFTIEIKRKKRERTLELVMPENRVGLRFMPEGFEFAPVAPRD